MCNHCHNHGVGEESKNQVRQGFLKMLADSSSQMSEMQAGIIIKNFGGGKTEVGSFGSLMNILDMSSQTYTAILNVVLDKAKSDNDLILAYMLFNKIVGMTDELKDFMTNLDKITDEIKSSMKEG